MTSEDTEFNFADDFNAWWIPAQFGAGSGDEELHRNTPLSEMQAAATPGHDRCRRGRLRDAARGGPHRLRDDDGRAGGRRRTVAAVGAGADAGRRGGARHGAAPVAVADAGDRRRPGRPGRVDAHPQPQPAVRDLRPGRLVDRPGQVRRRLVGDPQGRVRVVGRRRRCRTARTPRTSSATSTSPPRTAPPTCCRRAGTRAGRRCTRARTSSSRRRTSTSRRWSATPRARAWTGSPTPRRAATSPTSRTRSSRRSRCTSSSACPASRPATPAGRRSAASSTRTTTRRWSTTTGRVIQIAARHHLVVEAHEMVKDTGERRTYPNILTREAVRGMEWEAWSEGNPPEHLVEVPFTRMVAGPGQLHARHLQHHLGPGRTRPAALADARAHPRAQHPRRPAGDLPRLPERAPDDGRRPGELRGPVRPRVPRTRAHDLGRHRGPQRPGRRLRHRRPPQRPRLVHRKHQRRAAQDPVSPAAAAAQARCVATSPNIYGDAPTTDYDTNPNEIQITRIIVDRATP